jgi:hypothetical protein
VGRSAAIELETPSPQRDIAIVTDISDNTFDYLARRQTLTDPLIDPIEECLGDFYLVERDTSENCRLGFCQIFKNRYGHM